MIGSLFSMSSLLRLIPSHRILFRASIVTCLFIIQIFWTRPTFSHPNPSSDIMRYGSQNSCPQSAIADDILVVLRTGATEALKKVPTHFRTTLRCVPHHVVYSDLEETIEGHHVYDMLDEVDDEIKRTHPDFRLYNHLKIHGREGLDSQESLQMGDGTGGTGNLKNPGWALDKWKFLPMIDKALQHRPEAKWFVFIEPDTYLIWPNLLEYLARFNPSEPYYMGKHMYIDEILFGYGGAGIVLSKPAMQKVSEHRMARLAEYDQFTAEHWAGDCVLGKALDDAGVPLFVAFPHLQGDAPAALDPKTTKRGRTAWCHPAITYHHVHPQEVEDLSAFEQKWYLTNNTLLRYGDIFKYYIQPQLSASRSNWDNLSGDEYSKRTLDALTDREKVNLFREEKYAPYSFKHCRALCRRRRSCLQFSYSQGRCFISGTVRLGYEGSSNQRERIRSGWMLGRIGEFVQEMDRTCDGVEDWFLS
ncbi:glycosyltransferase family 31 protein [Lepidopterella palustris CBS 459.81]|uniref:N-acetylgalactosaminide beta-1,3-galactosyltransferase n=1 Tax=Lepidopterella palustris CBS 459.81 TaxID=1314670 RepID=A0A8E2E4Z7_9PEZI|nr:glycosyltransferase family 31 protein [Lepidopterella palustris CBS 459.81]